MSDIMLMITNQQMNKNEGASKGLRRRVAGTNEDGGTARKEANANADARTIHDVHDDDYG